MSEFNESLRAGLRVYSSLSRRVETFTLAQPPLVTMYACGGMPYDEAHLGHARQAIVFDVIRRYLEYLGYQVRYVRNYTDIDDKIIDRAKEQEESPLELSAHFVREN